MHTRFQHQQILSEPGIRNSLDTNAKFEESCSNQCCHIGRNLTQNADENLRSIGRRNFAQNARYFIQGQKSPKSPEFCSKMDENGRKLTPFYEKFFFQKILVKNFKIIFQNPAKLSHKNAIKRGARNFRQFIAKCPIFCKKFLATLHAGI